MDRNITPDTSSPASQSSPEEDITLLAIEALEARTVDPDPKPWSPSPRPSLAPSSVSTQPLQQHSTKVIEPVVSPRVTIPPTPVPAPTPPVVQSLPHPAVQVKPVVTHVKPDVTPPTAHTIAKKPKRQATPSEEMAEELAKSPARSYFQFFLSQKPSRKLFIIASIGIIIVVVGVVAYIVLR